MASRSKMALFTLTSASLLATAAAAQSAGGGERSFTTTLTGSAEVPGPGDSDGTGSATVTVNVSVPLLPLDRAQLLAATAAAADATASGKPLPVRNTGLVGRSFVIRLPFGCRGPLTDMESDWAGWSYDPKTEALKLRAQSAIWSDMPWVKAIAGETPFEAVEGFWIRWPWTSAESCPDGSSEEPMDRTSGISERQTVGIAQFFVPGGPRTMRRGPRPYAVTLKADEDIAAKPRQYHLLVSGRVTGFVDGQSIHCWNEADDLRPVCLIAAEFSRVAFENAADGSLVSEWRN